MYNKAIIMSNDLLVTVVVTTKNEEHHIEKCLHSIKNQSYKKIEIILVDNNSSDKTCEIGKKYTGIIFNKGPERSAQRNFGAKKAKGEYLLFIDADMILTENVVKECVLAIKKEKTGGVIIPERSIGEGYWANVKAFERKLYEGDSTIEAARFFRKNIFWEVGGYDEKITGPEDWDLPQRIKRKYKIGRIRSFIFHDEGRVSLFTLVKKKHYYGLKLSSYLGEHPIRLTASQVIYLLRPAFYKKWKTLIRNPFLTIGMIVMLFLEQIAGFIGFLEGKIKK